VLFVPNYRISKTGGNYSEGFAPSGPDGSVRYWFFKHFPDASVEIIDNASPFPWDRIARWSGFEVFQALKAFVRQGQKDVVISHSFNSALILALMRSLAGLRSPAHFVIDVGCLNGGRENPLELAVVRSALRSVSGLVYHSSVNEKFYRKHFPEVARRFVYFGTEPDFFAPLESPPSSDYALSIGYDKRDYETLLRAWREVDFPLKIVGRTDLDLLGCRNVELLPKVPVETLRSLIHNCSFAVLPVENVRYSVGQMTLLECMSMAKPVVASRSFGIIDYLRDEGNCLTYECGDAEELKKKVTRLLNDPELGRRLGSEARKDVLKTFNEGEMGRSIHGFIESVLSRST